MPPQKTNLQECFAQWVAEARQNSKEDFIVQMIQRVFQEAALRRASDIHIQPGRLGIDIRFRLSGVLQQVGVLPIASAAQIAARIKVLANLTTYKTSDPQEGRIRRNTIPNVKQDIRISTTPTLYGERIVGRFFSEGTSYLPIELGFPQQILEELSVAIQKTSGAIITAGPTGNGKTTTACSLLRAIINMEKVSHSVRSIITIEDPIEHAIDGVSQIEVARDGEMTLDRLIRYLMRQDPDVIMVGEIRDKPTAEAAFQAALTGHLLITTFHASSAASAICRLLELGIEPFTLRSSVSNILCQRLARRLCPCARAVNSQHDIEILGDKYHLQRWFEPVGCPKCNGTGFLDRFMIAESIPLTNEEVANAILERRSAEYIQSIGRKHGMITMGDYAAQYIMEGKTSPQEVLRSIGS